MVTFISMILTKTNAVPGNELETDCGLSVILKINAISYDSELLRDKRGRKLMTLQADTA